MILISGRRTLTSYSFVLNGVYILNNRNLNEFENYIGYNFNNKELMKLALTHSSYNASTKDVSTNNERLEFLGDAVLELSSSEFLYNEYKHKPEGELTRLRASIVCEPTLAECARSINLGKYLFLGKGEDMTGGRNRDSIISDAMEALIGAIYLDGGFDNARKFVLKFILNDIENKQLFYDSKTILQEMVQERKDVTIEYVLVDSYGPDHDKTFEVEVRADNKVLGHGKGRTKKRAEQQAAYEAILSLKSGKC